MENIETLLKAQNLTIGYKQGSKNHKPIAGPLDLEMCSGELICLLGPNGSGKSTLLRTLSGLQNALSGNIQLVGNQITKLKPLEIAKKLSLVLTESVKSGNLDVYALVSLGRYPYSGWLGTLTETDRNIIDQAIRSTHIQPFIHRKISQLSDGECQKVMLARALVQNTPLIILDEPTAHLDLPSRIELMRLLRKLAKETKKGILMSTHELDLALQVADKIWLIGKDGHIDAGSPESLILDGSFEAAFDKEGIAFDKSTGSFNLHEPGGPSINLIGDGVVAFWTKRALLRQGYLISNATDTTFRVEVVNTGQNNRWIVTHQGSLIEASSIDDLLMKLKMRVKQ